MKILSYKTNSFAGIKNRSYDFTEGTNLLLGPNEAGKSTIIDGIFHTIFTPAKLRKNLKKDTDFIDKYFPQGSDTIDGHLVMEIDGQRITIEKLWSKSDQSRERLTLEDGTVISGEEAIKKKIKDLMVFGQATYKYLNFSSHGDPRDSLYSITASGAVQKDISAYLTRAVMDLDGLSLDKLEAGIDKAMNDLGARWDFARDYPQNNRGIDNKYKNGLGKIISVFYAREDLDREIREGIKKEDELQAISENLRTWEKSLEEAKKFKAKYEDLGEDLRKRESLDKDLALLAKEEEDLKKAIFTMPQLEADLKTLKRDLEDLAKKKEALKKRLDYIGKREERLEIEGVVKAYKDLEEEKNKIKEGLEKLQDLDPKDFKTLEDLEKSIDLERLRLEAGAIDLELDIGGDIDLILKDALGKDLDKKSKTSYFSLESPGLFTLKVGLADVDFGEIRKLIEEKTGQAQKILAKNKVQNKEDFAEKLRKKMNLEEDLGILNRNLEMILKGRDPRDLEKSLEDLKAYAEDYSKDQTMKDLEALEEEISSLTKDQVQKDYSFNQIKEKYGSQEDIYKKVGEKSMAKEKTILALEKLAKLPEGFKDYDDFFNKKAKTDRAFEEASTRVLDLKTAQARAIVDLPPRTVEEMKLDYRDYDESFKAYKKKYQDLVLIKEAFVKTKKEMAGSPRKSLEESFRKYIDIITGSSIKLDSYKDRLRISNQTGDLSYIHLSKGSKDSLALALRLALIENLFKGPSFLALDDILNDMDQERRTQAIGLLKDFAKTNQIIFTSFNKDLAEELDARVIEV